MTLEESEVTYEPDDGVRSFELMWRPREQGSEVERRTVRLWAEIGTLLQLKNDADDSIDLLSGGADLTSLFQNPERTIRVMYELSDAPDLDGVKFASGFTGPVYREATIALRGALRAFFQLQGWREHVAKMDETDAITEEATSAVVEMIEQVNPSQLISETLRDEDFVSNAREQLRGDMRKAVESTLGDSSSPAQDD